MGTDIKIQKRISIQNEGVTVIPDVSNLNFLGNGVHASSGGTVNQINEPPAIEEFTGVKSAKKN
jgi:hypothetical protein